MTDERGTLKTLSELLTPLSPAGLSECRLSSKFGNSNILFQISEERGVSSDGCCCGTVYLLCGSASMRKHSSPVFSFWHSLHSSADVGGGFVSSYHCKKPKRVAMFLFGLAPPESLVCITGTLR